MEDRPEKDRRDRTTETMDINVAEAARRRGRDRKQVYRWMDRYGLR
ncbi:MAG: helix-turn-helix domain-containing protein [Deltaproteobacteria bacterium]|nr:helix-turn-helix domain-containing protein [Deltaproteobacteria bacterium]